MYTDYDNLALVFSGEMKHARELLNNMQIIEEYIESYYTHVRELHLFYYDKTQDKVYRIISNEKSMLS